MAQYELTLEAEFSAAHRLKMYDGQFEPLHGHNWRVEAYYEGDQLDSIGVAADFTVLRALLHEVIATLHDRYLNELPAFATVNPSTENVARHIFDALAARPVEGVQLAKVRVWETSGCAASYARRG